MEEPLTRSRTRLFLSLREPAFPPARWKGKARATEEEEEEGLLAGATEPQDHLPPRWSVGTRVCHHKMLMLYLIDRVDTVDIVETILDQLAPKIAHLERLHSKHARPGFKDRSAEEAEIERQTSFITDQFRRCQALLQELRPPDGSDSRLLANVRMGLATRLQDASSTFRKKQSNYLRRTSR